jgi:chaperonin cofactor prefoldin
MMNFEQVLERFKTEDPTYILDALDQLSKNCSVAASAAQVAKRAYYADVAEKEEKIKVRITALIKQRDELQSKIGTLKKSLVSATISGDVKKLEDIKANMRALEVDKAQVADEISLLESTHVHGDEALFNKALEMAAEHENLSNAYRAAKVEVYNLACDREKTFRRIQERAQNFHAGGGNGINVEEIKKHFYSEEIVD